MSDLFEEPRWKGGPLICVAENLPAFEALDAMYEFQKRLGESNIERSEPWLCRACGWLHYDSKIK